MVDEADPDGVILEFVRLGALVRVSAIDPASLTEVVLQGPAAAGEAALRRAALKKLAYVLARRERTTAPGPRGRPIERHRAAKPTRRSSSVRIAPAAARPKKGTAAPATAPFNAGSSCVPVNRFTTLPERSPSLRCVIPAERCAQLCRLQILDAPGPIPACAQRCRDGAVLDRQLVAEEAWMELGDHSIEENDGLGDLGAARVGSTPSDAPAGPGADRRRQA